jgi:hypothetical protein
MTRNRWFFPCLLGLLCTFAACKSASGDSSAERSEVLVTLYNYKSGARFELASESHTNRVDYYSGERDDAARKIQTDEVMSAFLRELDQSGLSSYAKTGKAPRSTQNEVIRWGLEVAARNGREVHWLVGTGSNSEEWKQFDQCRDTFLQLYNSTVSYQSVRNQGGKNFFDDRARAASGKKNK